MGSRLTSWLPGPASLGVPHRQGLRSPGPEPAGPPAPPPEGQAQTPGAQHRHLALGLASHFLPPLLRGLPSAGAGGGGHLPGVHSQRDSDPLRGYLRLLSQVSCHPGSLHLLLGSGLGAALPSRGSQGVVGQVQPGSPAPSQLPLQLTSDRWEGHQRGPLRGPASVCLVWVVGEERGSFPEAAGLTMYLRRIL